MSTVARLQVKAERDRLEEAKNIAESEKRLYAKVSMGTFFWDYSGPGGGGGLEYKKGWDVRREF